MLEASGFTTIKENGECSGPRLSTFHSPLSTLCSPLFSNFHGEGRAEVSRNGPSNEWMNRRRRGDSSGMNDTGWDRNKRIRTYGTSGPVVIVLHGGPAAPGGMADVARELADSFRVIEPWQRGSGNESLSVARHVEDLHELVKSRCDGTRPALVGHSWGAMLALGYAAAHPHSAGPLVLIGCGTFDPAARARYQEIRDGRMDGDLRRRLERLPDEFPEPDERQREHYRLTGPLDSYDPIPANHEEAEPFDLRAHTETWGDMLRLQGEGVYPAAFAAIDAPVLMLHGAFDPHPGRMIRDSLLPYIAHLEYHEWERCGHEPWLEKAVREEFFTILREWLTDRLPLL